ncbi:MAG: iron-containing alcohol dehydrogenase [Actinomycetota bacterium]|nr:iron-containing alcohol dehydrogenase [Actinomycetota bacterium]
MSQPVGVPPFRNHLPVRIHFGDGISGMLPDLLKAEGVDRAALIIDDGLPGFNPPAADIIAAVEAAGIILARYDKPAGEPTVAMIDAATVVVAGSGAQAVIALGGGSVIDTAKAARLCAQLGTDFRGFLASDRQYPQPDVLLFALPTTAGTGSEVSGGAVVSDPEAGTKSGIANPLLRAQYALVDPVLTHTSPPATTSYAGVDALAQAIAGMIARSRTPIGDAIALEAVRLISRSLVAAHRDGSNAAARSDMACGSMMAGLTMNISDCTAEHSLGQAIGGMFHVPHGLTIGLVLEQTLDRERAHVPEQLERVADAMGAPPGGPADGSRAVEAVRRLLAELDFPVFGSLGVTDAQLDELTALALDDYFITESPHPWAAEEVRAAFAASLAVTGR